MDEATASTVAAPTPAGAAQSYTINFSPKGAPGKPIRAQNARWRWTGEGKVTFDGEDVVLCGRRNWLFNLSRYQEIRVRAGNIINVVVGESTVRCQVYLADGKSQSLGFATASNETALAIAARLPKEHSREFKEQEEFNRALLRGGERVVVTPVLVGTNIAVLVLMALTGVNLFQPPAPAMISWGSNFSVLTLSGQWWRLFTSMFLHFGILHLAFNMWALARFGPVAERLFGSTRYALLYVFAGLCGSLASALWNPVINSAGASGAIFGVMGGMLAFIAHPKSTIPGSVVASMAKSGIAFVAYNLINGFAHTGIDNACHLGGLLSGFAMGWLLARPLNDDARQHEVRGLLVGLAVGAAALLALSWTIIRPTPEQRAQRQFRLAFVAYADQESKTLKLTNDIYRLAKQHQISDVQFADQLRDEVIPSWQSAENTIASVQVPASSKVSEVKAALLDFVETRRLGLNLIVTGITQNDSSKVTLGTNAIKSSDAKAKAFIELYKSI